MSFTAESRERTRPAIPLASMIDILFLLLIFFMTASVFRQQELQIPVQLSVAESAEGAGTADRIAITIQQDGSIYLGPRELTMPELRNHLHALAEISPDQPVSIRGDERSELGLTVRILDLAQQAGFTDAGIDTVQPPEN